MNILMCEPTFFQVDYVINPWMAHNVGKANNSLAFTQWSNLVTALEKLGNNVLLVPPEKGLPDIVFTANAGLVFGNNVIISNFNKPERQPETKFYAEWFQNNYFNVIMLPDEVSFEGAGDALFDNDNNLWLAHGFRSDEVVKNYVKEYCNVFSLKLVNDNFYHLDTCFCPLTNGYVLYTPSAFDDDSLKLIKGHFKEKAIEVWEHDAKNFACNAVSIGDNVILNSASDELISKLSAVGFNTIQVEMSEFIKSGGSCKCLTLKLI